MSMLDGIKVIEISTLVAGPGTARYLASMGADVVKIERMGTGDDARLYPPSLWGVGLPFFSNNYGKKSVTMDITDPEAVEIIKKMIVDTDIFIESFKPGVMAKYGLDYETLSAINPRLIYASISTFGQHGPLSNKPGYDIIAQAVSGIMDITGERNGPPMRIGTMLGDSVGRIQTLLDIVSALYMRDRTGRGQYIDISLTQVLADMNMDTYYDTMAGIRMTRDGNHMSAAFPYGMFEGKDGQYAIICAPNDRFWGILCKIMGREDLIDTPKTNSVTARIQNQAELIPIVDGWLQTFDNIQDAIDIMDAAGIACSKVYSTKDLVESEYFKARKSLVDIPATPSQLAKGAPETFKLPALPVELADSPEVVKSAPPDLGQHNYEVLGQYGFTKEQVDALQAKWAGK